MDALAELSQTIRYLRTEAQEHKQRAEFFQSQCEALKLELDLLRQQLQQSEQAKLGQSEQLEPLKLQIQHLQAENAEYRAKLQKLEGFARSIFGNQPDVPMMETPSIQNAIQQSPLGFAVPKGIEQPPTTIPQHEASVENTKPTTNTQRKPRSPGRRSARSKLDGAVSFIQQRNQDSPPDLQWAITQSLIASLTGSNIANTVKPFWTQIKHQMEQYNHDLSLDDRANYGRSQEIPLLKDEFQSWLQAQVL